LCKASQQNWGNSLDCKNYRKESVPTLTRFDSLIKSALVPYQASQCNLDVTAQLYHSTVTLL